MTTKAKPGTFEIATMARCADHATTPSVGICRACLHAAPGRSTRKGLVCGDFAAHREPGKGVYFWTFTHLRTGMSCASGVCASNKAQALVALEVLAAEGLPAYAVKALEGSGWGGMPLATVKA